MYNPFSLEKKTILVTGASSGIGRSIAIECSRMGATLVISGRNHERLNQTFSELSGNYHLQIPVNLIQEEELQKLTEEIPKLDGVVHVAGIVTTKPFRFLNRIELNEIMDVNFFAPILLTNKILRKNKFNKSASIVFISSISGVKVSFPGGASYSASKGALNGIIKGMALDLAPKQIRVNSIIPGMIDTGLFEGTGITNEDLKKDIKNYPLGRYGKPEEVAYATIFLLSGGSSWMTGSNILLDGGFTLI